MTTEGTVRFWRNEDGWGVIDSVQTPGGCWAHISAVAVEGYKSLESGQAVLLEWEAAQQDGYAYRAVSTWPADRPPADELPASASTACLREHADFDVRR